MREETLVTLIKKLIKKVGSETADNALAGMLIIKPDYFALKRMLKEYLETFD